QVPSAQISPGGQPSGHAPRGVPSPTSRPGRVHTPSRHSSPAEQSASVRQLGIVGDGERSGSGGGVLSEQAKAAANESATATPRSRWRMTRSPAAINGPSALSLEVALARKTTLSGRLLRAFPEERS